MNPNAWKPGQSGNPAGRPKGSKNKLSAADIAEARTVALACVPDVWERRDRHTRSCPAKNDCAMCRHYNTMVMEYAYGKPPQRQELIMATVERDIKALAKEMGLTESEAKAAVAEVRRQYDDLKKA